jgi:hypothetical protein
MSLVTTNTKRKITMININDEELKLEVQQHIDSIYKQNNNIVLTKSELYEILYKFTESKMYDVVISFKCKK